MADVGTPGPSRRSSSATFSTSPGSERTVRPSALSSSSYSDRTVRPFALSSESTPLLLPRDEPVYGTQTRSRSRSSSVRSSIRGYTSEKKRPTYISLAVLTASILGILVFVFAAPAIVKRYAEEATVFTPKDLSIDSNTPSGIRARVQGEFVIDSSRVSRTYVRSIGRLATFVAGQAETGQTEARVYLPEYGNILVGTAFIPPIKVSIRNRHVNHVDFLTDLTTGDVRGMRSVAMDWLEGRMGRLRLKCTASTHLKSGLLSLGSLVLSDERIFRGMFGPSALCFASNSSVCS